MGDKVSDAAIDQLVELQLDVMMAAVNRFVTGTFMATALLSATEVERAAWLGLLDIAVRSGIEQGMALARVEPSSVVVVMKEGARA